MTAPKNKDKMKIIKLHSYILIAWMLVSLNLNGEDKTKDETVTNYHSKLAGGYYSNGIELLKSSDKSEAYKSDLATTLAATAFEYYFLHVKERKIEKDVRIEYLVRELLKLDVAKKSFLDPLAWLNADTNFSRGNLSEYGYKWHADKDAVEYKSHVKSFNEYFAKEFSKN